MASENDAELLKAQQHLGPILRFIANQPVGIPPPQLAAFSAPTNAQIVLTSANSGADGGGTAGHHGSGINPAHLSRASLDGSANAQSAAVVAAFGGGHVPGVASLANAYATTRPSFQQSTAAPSAKGVVSASSVAGADFDGSGSVAASGSMSRRSSTAQATSLSNTEDTKLRKSSFASTVPAPIENDSADEDDDDAASLNASSMAVASNSSRKSESRRAAHTSAEQKRRDDIKHGYEDLATLIPSCQGNNNNGQKLSKAVILQRSIDYLSYLKKHRQQQEQDLVSLRNEVVALRIMKRNYEQIAKAHTTLSPEKTPQVSDAAKFEVFKAVMDTLFQSFDACISVNNFEVLSSSIFQWLEEFCKPQNMRGIVISSLQTLQKQPPGTMYGSRQ